MNKQMKAFCDRKKKDPEYYEVIQKYKIDMTLNRKIRFVFTSNSYEFIDIFKNDTFVSIYWVPTKSIIKVGTYEKFRERYLEYYSYMHKEE